MDEHRARALVARERSRIEAALAELSSDERSENQSHLDQTGESADAGAELQETMTSDALLTRLRDELAAVERAEARIAHGTYGRSIESGAAIPYERLEAEPLAERTVGEQERLDRDSH